jgi:hypothetical protein
MVVVTKSEGSLYLGDQGGPSKEEDVSCVRRLAEGRYVDQISLSSSD